MSNIIVKTKPRYIIFADVIGHVVEKDEIKETDANGKKAKLIDISLEDLE